MISLKYGYCRKLFPVISIIIVLVSLVSLEGNSNSIRVLYQLYPTEAVHIFLKRTLTTVLENEEVEFERRAFP